jgi:hypothetical protein
VNILNRLKTLEEKAGITNSEYCRCYGEEPLKMEVVPISIEEYKRRFDAGEESMTKLPDVCEECRKPIDKRFIETTFEEMQAKVTARLKQVEETKAKFAD